MPRQARLDLPGLLQHVIARGIQRRTIFRDDEDREAFVRRLSKLLVETDTDCFAWALLPNHFHLVLRPNRQPLANLMRRLQTGHAVTFNLRHKRSGHLFQNRYKSIVCEEEEYLLELVRYVHLNPLRGSMVADLDALRQYPWSGHAVLLGVRDLAGQATEEVLGRFGSTFREARRAYGEFVAAGVSMGRRRDLVGGGLQRSLKRIGPTKDRIVYDERVLGSSEFVSRLKEDEGLRNRLGPSVTLEDLVERVATHYGTTVAEVQQRRRNPTVVDARGVACFVGIRELGCSTSVVGKFLNMSASGVSMAARRGAKIVQTPLLQKLLKW